METKLLILSCLILLAMSSICASDDAGDMLDKANKMVEGALANMKNMPTDFSSLFDGTMDPAELKEKYKKLTENTDYQKELKELEEQFKDKNTDEYKDAAKALWKKYVNGAQGMTASVISILTAFTLLVFMM